MSNLRIPSKRRIASACEGKAIIRVSVVQDTLDSEGGMVIYLTGHATPVVCAGVSAVVHTAIDGLARMAKENPKHLAFHATVKKKQSTRR